MPPAALKMLRKMLSDMVCPGKQKFSKKFNAIAENFYPSYRIKIFGGIIFLGSVRSYACFQEYMHNTQQ